MLELLILNSISERSLTLYGIKKYITENFGIFSVPSLGAIHPAIQKFEKNGLLTIAKNMSDGGKKTLHHLITDEGKKYFVELFTNIKSTVPTKISTEIKIKIVILQNIKEIKQKETFFENAITKIEENIYDIKNFISNHQNGYLETSASIFLKEFADLKYHLELLKKEELAK